MSLNPLAAAIGGLVVVLSLWSADHARQARDAALAQNVKLASFNDALSLALTDRANVQRLLTEIGRDTQRIYTTLDSQSVLINRNLAEMKRHDKAVADYLDSAVPAALGLRYARPETTDPAAWRVAASVQPGAVPAPGSAAADPH
ncbi:hypothetical protein HER21_28855 [Pseudomonas sp. BGM005]|nr:hypothetical protein [Pseudomonas sp. BG5]